MTLEKAIEVYQQEMDDPGSVGFLALMKARLLGFEALKRIVYLRKDMDCPHWMTLPGETE